MNSSVTILKSKWSSSLLELETGVLDFQVVKGTTGHTSVLCSQLQLLQVSPARPNFHFYCEFHWEFYGIFHFVFNNLCYLQGDIKLTDSVSDKRNKGHTGLLISCV